MADITMCTGLICNKKETCYRYKATPSTHQQSYFVIPPNKNGDCDMHLEYCDKCGQFNGVHKMGCETRKVTIKL
jgi:hypothetical protein